MPYAYEHDASLSPEENANNSMKMDKWRSRNAPTSESARKQVVLAQEQPLTELVRQNGHSPNYYSELWH